MKEEPRPPLLVVLAAGESRRLGRPKALVRLGDDPPRTPLGLLLEAGAVLGDPRPLVVAGASFEALRPAVPAHAELLRHTAWELGRTGSVRAAVGARPDRDLCLAPVDVPLVPAAVFSLLRAAWLAAGSPARGWLAPRLDDGPRARFGHPVVIGRSLARDLEEFSEDTPLRRLRERADPLLAVPVSEPAILDDLDTPEDLARLRRRFAGR